MKGFDLMMKFKKTEHEQLTFFKYLLAAHLLFTGCGHHLVNNQGKYIYIYINLSSFWMRKRWAKNSLT